MRNAFSELRSEKYELRAAGIYFPYFIILIPYFIPMNYDPQKIEKKWQKKWTAEKVFEAKDDPPRRLEGRGSDLAPQASEKYYALVEFPYPSGAGMHMGHLRSYTAFDVLARKRRMEGYNVLFPMGWDAFGLPTENYAIKTGIPPQTATKQNTTNFRKQLQSLGYSFDWSREVNTTDPQYYKWTQWIFLQLFKAGLAYKARVNINWCPKDKIGLANEEVISGKCERCGTAVEQREKEQWMLKITAYADKLLEGLKEVEYLPEIKAQQENWIGRSEGAEIEFPLVIASLPASGGRSVAIQLIKVFTTRPDTISGATYLVLAPEHSIIEKIKLQIANYKEVQEYIAETKLKSDLDRSSEGKAKTGVELKGIKVINPATKEKIPVWIGDYVLVAYGTGAIMAVPQHDERDRAFAETFKLPIVDKPLISFDEALAITGGKKTVTYKLRDWVFSRQRYWGEPIPLINCAKCGWVAVPEKDLPVKLPKVEKYQPTDNGESPLSTMTKWVNTKCPQCKGPAKRETDTMPNWAGSSWYYMAYLLSPNAFKNPVSLATWNLELDKLSYWLPVDWYNGGMEHVTLHLLYSRFWNLFLYDQGLVPVKEPYQKRTAQGTILASDGAKMSKSVGNIVNPDDFVKEFGADALRLYILFIAPFNQAAAWDNHGVLGTARFLEKIWKIGIHVGTSEARVSTSDTKVVRLLHKTIKKVSEDIESMSFNTAVSAMMIFINQITNYKLQITNEDWQKFLKILSPFAPHITEELNSLLATRDSLLLCQQPWPSFDPSLIIEHTFDLIIQVNGRVRGTIQAQKGITQAEAIELALLQESIKKWVSGAPKKVIFVPDRLINLII